MSDNPSKSGATTTSSPKGSAIVESIAVFGSMFLAVITFPFSLIFLFQIVREYERAVIFRMGRLKPGDPRGPGLIFVLPCTDDYFKIDLRTVTFDVPCQEVLTKDCVTVAVDAVVFYKVANPLGAVVNIENYSYSTRTLAATTLRNVMGTYLLSEILTQREALARIMQGILDEATEIWGVKVERVEIKDVRLPVQLQRAMAAEAEAAREARAKVIAAEGEMQASQALRKAADVMSNNPTTLQLRYLQTLGSMSAETKSTIVFPLPLNFLGLSK